MDAKEMVYELNKELSKKGITLLKSSFGNRVYRLVKKDSIGAYVYVKECSAKMPIWGLTEKYLKIFAASGEYHIILTYKDRIFLIDKKNINRVMENAGYSKTQGEYKINELDVCGGITIETSFVHLCEVLKNSDQ